MVSTHHSNKFDADLAPDPIPLEDVGSHHTDPINWPRQPPIFIASVLQLGPSDVTGKRLHQADLSAIYMQAPSADRTPDHLAP